MDDLVMRSVYLRPSEDSQLRQLAHELSVTKSDLIRSAISTKLQEWRESNSNEQVMHDLTFGRRDSVAERNAQRLVAIEREPLGIEGPKAAPTQETKKKKNTATKKTQGPQVIDAAVAEL